MLALWLGLEMLALELALEALGLLTPESALEELGLGDAESGLEQLPNAVLPLEQMQRPVPGSGVPPDAAHASGEEAAAELLKLEGLGLEVLELEGLLPELLGLEALLPGLLGLLEFEGLLPGLLGLEALLSGLLVGKAHILSLLSTSPTAQQLPLASLIPLTH